MRLINDEYNDCWVWVEDHNEDLELSPHFDYEEDAIQWRDRMLQEIKPLACTSIALLTISRHTKVVDKKTLS
jgi:hypothetical protein